MGGRSFCTFAAGDFAAVSRAAARLENICVPDGYDKE